MTGGAILVIGAAGLIGGRLVRRLVAEGAAVIATDRQVVEAHSEARYAWLIGRLAKQEYEIAHTLGAFRREGVQDSPSLALSSTCRKNAASEKLHVQEPRQFTLRP
jgi:nucleoside-diphosphate-sugar epimerase